MGFCKTIRAGFKELRKELTREVFLTGATLMGGLAPAIADGRLSKTEADSITTAGMKALHGITTTAAGAAIKVLAKSMKAEVDDPTTATTDQAGAARVIVADIEATTDAALPPAVEAELS